MSTFGIKNSDLNLTVKLPPPPPSQKKMSCLKSVSLSFFHLPVPPPPPRPPLRPQIMCLFISCDTAGQVCLRPVMIFFALLSALRRSRPALVIRSFITLPARHSAVAANAISPDSHNYPRIERGKGERIKNFSKQNCGSDRVYMGKKRFFIVLNLTFLQFCLFQSESINHNSYTASASASFVLRQTGMIPAHRTVQRHLPGSSCRCFFCCSPSLCCSWSQNLQ